MELDIVKKDSWLSPFAEIIEGRHNRVLDKIKELTGGKSSLSDFASGYLYFGLHRTKNGGWVLREWAPNAQDIYMIGDFSEWKE